MIERKADVLAGLLSSSWMADAGWTPSRIAAHYQADRDWRAAVKRLRRRGVVPTLEAIKDYQRSVARRARSQDLSAWREDACTIPCPLPPSKPPRDPASPALGLPDSDHLEDRRQGGGGADGPP